MEFLVVLEVSQKQNYIFKTNRLAENIGASIIIRDITEKIPDEYLPTKKEGTDRNLEDISSETRENQNEPVKGRKWFAGGGKSVYIFPTKEEAKNFIKNVSTRVLRDYPGVELFMAMHEYDVSNTPVVIGDKSGGIKDEVDKLYAKLETKKASRQHSFRLYGLGISEQCVSTQLPAVNKYEIDGIERLVSKESLVKFEKARNEQDAFFAELLPDKEKYVFAKRFDELGGTEDVKDYLAVVVVDGNKMGKRIQNFGKQFAENNPVKNSDYTDFNHKYEDEFREYSNRIDLTWKSAMKRTVKVLADKLDELVSNETVKENIADDGRIIMPMRPLILAGDDICFVCDSRICLNLAETLLLEVEKVDNQEIKGVQDFHAACGIAIVKNHYPFFRAHELAEQLISNAKAALKADEGKTTDKETVVYEKNNYGDDASILDFLIVEGEISGELKDIRRDKYYDYSRKKDMEGHVNCDYSLTNKPYYLDERSDKVKKRGNSMTFFKERIGLFQDKRIVGRGLIKEYRFALAEGPKVARKYLVNKRLENIIGESFVPVTQVLEDGSRKQIETCRDFDVIEMIDIYKAWK